MNKEVRIILGLIISLCILPSIVGAAFTYHAAGSSIQQSYSAGEIIRGKINLTLSGEPASSVFSSNFNGSRQLYELLYNNNFREGTDFNCTYKLCEPGFKTVDAVTNGGVIDIVEGTPSYVGFKISGSTNSNVEISSLKFTMSSSNSNPSCSRQIIVDVLDGNETFIQNNKNSGVMCDDEYRGCFDNSLASYLSAIITSNPYCEKISLRPAPAYVLGATVKNGTKTTILTMKLFSAGEESLGDFLDECVLPKNKEETEKLGCVVNYSVATGGDYYVCVEAKDDDSNHKIRVETRAPLCGTNTQSTPYIIDYDVYAKPLAFDAIGSLSINETLFAQQNYDQILADYANQYLALKYNSNCTKGCVIPFKIEGISQDITFSNIAMTYNAMGGTLYEESMYELQKEESKITTRNPVIIELDKARFLIPINSNATKLYLYLGGKTILPSPLTIAVSASFDFDITPKTVLAGAITQFSAVTPANIISSSWDFGDGVIESASGKTISHRYSEIKPEGYKVTVELIRSDGVSSRRVFDVYLGGLGDSARNLTDEYSRRLEDISKQASSFGPAMAKVLEDAIDLNNMKMSFEQIKRNLANGTDEGRYANIITQLLQLDVPYSFFARDEWNAIPLSIGFENMNTEVIEAISAVSLDSADKKENLKASIVSWTESNYAGSIDYKVVSKFSDSNDKIGEPIATSFKVTLQKTGTDDSASNAYLIIDYPKESIIFAQNYSEKSAASATYIPISDSRTIEFILDGKVDAQDLGMYLSPEISKLEGFGEVEEAERPGFNWGRFWLWTIILLIIAFVVYVALQEWYKKRYEAYLFKNPNDLYNIIHFIFNSRKNGLSDADIDKKLKSTGWKGEQVTYAFKKLDGKRTGMWEIPIFRFFERKKVKEEIEKRQTAQKPVQPAAFR